jgi:hypothetical protein
MISTMTPSVVPLKTAIAVWTYQRPLVVISDGTHKGDRCGEGLPSDERIVPKRYGKDKDRGERAENE